MPQQLIFVKATFTVRIYILYIGQDISNMQTKWQLSAGNEKSIPALKINILWDMANSIPFLAPNQFH